MRSGCGNGALNDGADCLVRKTLCTLARQLTGGRTYSAIYKACLSGVGSSQSVNPFPLPHLE